ncbi:hypothetical protein [Microbacterium sp. A84]|uniref:hypothetical protein n=1 Tax=Microbacterium sp. A84 TaxID=3450715 RepID=UPI003F43BF3F
MSEPTTYDKPAIVFVTPPVHLHPLLDSIQIQKYLPAALSADVFTAFRRDGETDMTMTPLDLIDLAESALERATVRVREFIIIHDSMLDVTPLRERFPHIAFTVAVCDADDWTARRWLIRVHDARKRDRKLQQTYPEHW